MPPSKDFSDGQYDCSVCGIRKPLSDFPPDKGTKSGKHSRCYVCKRNNEREYQKTEKYLNRRRAMEWKRRGIKDISTQKYSDLLKAQNKKCAICGTDKNISGKVLCVDHDHKTGLTRGLLCTKCNLGIGYLKDDLDIIYKAVSYLEEHEMRVSDAC